MNNKTQKLEKVVKEIEFILTKNGYKSNFIPKEHNTTWFNHYISFIEENIN